MTKNISVGFAPGKNLGKPLRANLRLYAKLPFSKHTKWDIQL